MTYVAKGSIVEIQQEIAHDIEGDFDEYADTLFIYRHTPIYRCISVEENYEIIIFYLCGVVSGKRCEIEILNYNYPDTRIKTSEILKKVFTNIKAYNKYIARIQLKIHGLKKNLKKLILK